MYAVPDKKDQIHYALDTAGKLLEFYNTFFDIDYPLSKLGEQAFPESSIRIIRFAKQLLSIIKLSVYVCLLL